MKNIVRTSDFCLFRRLSFLHYLTTCHLTLSWKSLCASHVTAFAVDSWCLSPEAVAGKLLSVQPSPLTKAVWMKNKYKWGVPKYQQLAHQQIHNGYIRFHRTAAVSTSTAQENSWSDTCGFLTSESTSFKLCQNAARSSAALLFPMVR